MKYNAFISYSHVDRDCAERLERELNILAMSKGIERFRIFRDMTYSELNEDVADGLIKNLEQSEWLIVICSPAVSVYKENNWVDFECNYFINELNRSSNVICFISSGAPFQEDISSFYPLSIRERSRLLAADGRSEKEWFKNVVKTFHCILDSPAFEKEQDKDVRFLMEFGYINILRDSLDLYQKKKRREALEKLSGIPYTSGVKSIEWYLLYAIESGMAYRNFCGYPQEKVGNCVIAFDYEKGYLCSTDGKNLFVIDCRTLQVVRKFLAHDGTGFVFASKLHQRQFVTWGTDFWLKVWTFYHGNISLVMEKKLQRTFYSSEKPVFAPFYDDNCDLVCLCNNTDDCAAVTGETLTVVNVSDRNMRSFHIPYSKRDIFYSPKWNMLSFSEQGDEVALANDRMIYIWNLKEEGICHQYPRQEAYRVFGNQQTTVRYPVRILEGGLWDWEECWSNSANAMLVCDMSKYLLIADESKELILWDMESVEDTDDNFLGGSRIVLASDISFVDIVTQVPGAVSSHWIAYTDHKNRIIRLCDRNGTFVRERQVCDYENVRPLSDEELGLPSEHSSLLKKYINEIKNPEWFTVERLEFISADCLAVGCSKKKNFLWKIPEDEWIAENDAETKEYSFGINGKEQEPYVTINGRRKVVRDGKELVFSDNYDGREIIRIPFPFEIKSFYFVLDETVLILVSNGKVYRYEIPKIPDEANKYLEKVFAERRKKYFGTQEEDS